MSKVTIYTCSDFMGNIIRTEAKLLGHERKKYAQYNDALHVSFVPKGKRKPLVHRATYRPFVLVLEGWNHPEADSLCGEYINGVSNGRYMSFDERWREDFNVLINEYIINTKVNIVLDERAI